MKDVFETYLWRFARGLSMRKLSTPIGAHWKWFCRRWPRGLIPASVSSTSPSVRGKGRARLQGYHQRH